MLRAVSSSQAGGDEERVESAQSDIKVTDTENEVESSLQRREAAPTGSDGRVKEKKPQNAISSVSPERGELQSVSGEVVKSTDDGLPPVIRHPSEGGATQLKADGNSPAIALVRSCSVHVC